MPASRPAGRSDTTSHFLFDFDMTVRADDTVEFGSRHFGFVSTGVHR